MNQHLTPSTRRPFHATLLAASGTLALLLSLPGCTALEAESRGRQAADSAEPLIPPPATPAPPTVAVDPHIIDGPDHGGYATRMRNGVPLPAAVERPGIEFTAADTSTLRQLAASLSRKTGLHIVVTDDTLDGKPPASSTGVLPLQQPAFNPGAQAPNPEDLPTNAAVLAQLMGSAVPAATATAAPEPTMGFNVTGSNRVPLSHILNQMASRFGMSWTFDGAAVKIYRYVTRTWKIETFDTVTDVDATLQASNGNMSGATGNGSASSQSGQGREATTTKAKVSPWAEVVKSIKDILPANDHKLTDVPSLGRVTVRAPQDTIDLVDRVVRDINDDLGRTVEIAIDVLSVVDRATDNYASAVDLALSAAGLTFTTNAATAVAANAAGTLTTNILGTSHLNGTQVAIQALSKAGLQTRYYRLGGQIKNNSIRPFKQEQFEDYIQSVTLPSTANSALGNYVVSPTVVQGTSIAGTDARIRPRILDGVIETEVMLSVADLPTRDEISPATGLTIQQRTGSRTQVPFTARVPSGRTLMVAYSADSINSSTRSGVGSARNPVGGGIDGSMTQNRLIIFLTATEKDPRRSILPPADAAPPLTPGTPMVPPPTSPLPANAARPAPVAALTRQP